MKLFKFYSVLIICLTIFFHQSKGCLECGEKCTNVVATGIQQDPAARASSRPQDSNARGRVTLPSHVTKGKLPRSNDIEMQNPSPNQDRPTKKYHYSEEKANKLANKDGYERFERMFDDKIDDCFRISYYSDQGRKSHMTDAFKVININENTKLFGVFDGHGSKYFAHMAADELLPEIAKRLRNIESDRFGGNANVLEVDNMEFVQHVRAAEIILDEIRIFAEDMLFHHVKGVSSYNIVVIGTDESIVINAGNSRAIVVTTFDEAQAISLDHTFREESEQKRLYDRAISIPPGYLIEGHLKTSRGFSNGWAEKFGFTWQPDGFIVNMSTGRIDNLFHIKDCAPLRKNPLLARVLSITTFTDGSYQHINTFDIGQKIAQKCIRPNMKMAKEISTKALESQEPNKKEDADNVILLIFIMTYVQDDMKKDQSAVHIPRTRSKSNSMSRASPRSPTHPKPAEDNDIEYIL